MFIGGYGALEELLEVITWAQLGIHDKPVGLLNLKSWLRNWRSIFLAMKVYVCM
ncbi:hypothetical protein BVRB_7g161790 [Beta vulgaris subsp. vulgaris]|nr:hypothetical protein BVRB_7g161790 [Beta vulgaris subsp. vulgaris]